MRILSRYILREHIGPILFALVITLFVLIVDFIPSIVELIIGKSLDVFTVLWVFTLNLAWMLVLAVPMAVLIATLMAFGRLSSDFEILAMKTSGINVLRMIYPVLMASLILAGGLVWFNNAILPEANHKARVLMGDIRVMRPTLSIKSNIFINDIPGYFILIGDVDHETARIRDVLIYDQRSRNVSRTITADRGYLEFLEGGQVLSFELEDGEIYEEDAGYQASYRRVAFKKQLFNIRDMNRELRVTESSHRSDREMSTTMMLEQTDALRENIENFKEEIDRVLLKHLDPHRVTRGDTMSADYSREEQLSLVYVLEAIKNLRNTRNLISNNLRKIDQLQKSINVYLLEVHKKFSIPTACVVFVLIGAPLGILARRGGFGTAIGISVGLFMVYWAFLIGGEELSDRGFVSPVLSMWMPNILIGAVGLMLFQWVITERSPLAFMGGLRNTRLWIRFMNTVEKALHFFKGEMIDKKHKPRTRSDWIKKIRLIRILDNYLLMKFVRAFVLSLVVFILIMHLVHLIEHLDTYIDRKAGFKSIVMFYVYFTPFIVILTTPVATLLGAIFTVGLMARGNEILAIKASGVSLWRVALPLLIAGMVISILSFVASDKLLPYTNQRKSEIRYGDIENLPDFRSEYYSNFHRRGEQGRIFNFRLYSPQQKMGKDAEIHTYQENRLVELIEAKELSWKDSIWVAYDGTKTIFSDIDKPQTQDSLVSFDTLFLPALTEHPTRFARRQIDPRDFGYDQSISDLKQEIENKRKNGIDPTPERVYLMFKYSLPLTSFIIILIAVPLASDPRRGSPAIGFAFAIGISFAYMVIFEVFRTLGTSGKIPPAFAAWSINVIFFLIGLYMMFRARK
ncbi:MAG: LptF/LptG family permease [candidate division Zixibacteria bacterium]|nr:LptF/LptG family permease [candidate division Zixibacteria bacterium]